MISECVADFIAKLTSVPELANSSGLTLGGKGTDPGLKTVPLPAAWVMYATDTVDEEPFGHSSHQPGMNPSGEVMLLAVHSLIYLPYATQEDMLTIQLPLLETVIRSIRGTEAPSGHRWRYLGQKLAVVLPDRIAYEQHYTLTAFI
jgi:hypothetical protein